jgi:prephenate dehydrogenase
MKKIAVIGMGIIGGSICAALSSAGYFVDGFGRSERSINYALKMGYIKNRGTVLSDYDVVFIAVPPQATIEYLDTANFKDGALVCDICGVKQKVEEAVYAKPRAYRYVGLHPMAGKETSGIDSASSTLFKNANLIITRTPLTKETDVDEVKEYAKAMQFGKLVECTAKEHDEKIALTSQLAHLVSNAYVKSPEVLGCEPFTGGSFQDMTRIAGVDEKIWSQLYLFNRENIVQELDLLISHLQEYRDAIEGKNEREISDYLKAGRFIREKIKRKNS